MTARLTIQSLTIQSLTRGAIFAFVLPMQLIAQTSAQTTVNCAGIDSDIARLQCYDEREARQNSANTDAPAIVVTSEPAVIVPPTPPQAAVATIETPVAAPASVPTASNTIPERIVYRSEPEPQPEEISSSIVSINTALNGRQVFLLENGERWQETRAYGLRFMPGSTVNLKKGYFNGYNMTSGRNTVRVAKVD